MDTKDFTTKIDDLKDQTAERFEEAKENVEDVATDIKQDIDRKGGEVKGRAEQWQDDRTDDSDQAAKTHSSELDDNPLDED